MNKSKNGLYRMEKQPDEIKPIWLNAVLMPTGEIIYRGKTIGKFKNDKKFIFITV